MNIQSLAAVAHYVLLDRAQFLHQWLRESNLAHVIGTPGESSYKPQVTKFSQIKNVNVASNTGLCTITGCCGSIFIDCSKEGKITEFYDKAERAYKNYSYEDMAKDPKCSRGIGVYINNKGQVPEKVETESDVWDTFTFPDGEKITFQFRKAEND